MMAAVEQEVQRRVASARAADQAAMEEELARRLAQITIGGQVPGQG